MKNAIFVKDNPPFLAAYRTADVRDTDATPIAGCAWGIIGAAKKEGVVTRPITATEKTVKGACKAYKIVDREVTLWYLREGGALNIGWGVGPGDKCIYRARGTVRFSIPTKGRRLFEVYLALPPDIWVERGGVHYLYGKEFDDARGCFIGLEAHFSREVKEAVASFIREFPTGLSERDFSSRLSDKVEQAFLDGKFSQIADMGLEYKGTTVESATAAD